MKLSLILLILSSLALAKAPSDFKDSSKQFRFVDFSQVQYEIVYDLENKMAVAKTIINFDQKKPGHPIFDLIPEVQSIELDGVTVKAISLRSPGNESHYRSIDTSVKAGAHTLSITNDRQYIEQYVPSNIEYDQFAVSMNLEIIGTSKEHTVYTNGEVSNQSKNQFVINYPDYYTASSLYFHIAPVGKFQEVSFKFKSKSNKNIPVRIYKKKSIWSTSLSTLKENTLEVLNELESNFGNWPHPSLTIYNAGMGGMEYSGATITSTSALGHELTHSYFARGVMPVDGNSGWMDEAIASWRDDGYQSVSSPNFSKTSMAAHSQYRRYTDRNAYTKGANFMAYLNNKLESQGGLTSFLNELHTNFTHTNITTHDFIKEINGFSGLNFNSDFDRYIFAKSNMNKTKETPIENPYHPILTEKQLFELL